MKNFQFICLSVLLSFSFSVNKVIADDIEPVIADKLVVEEGVSIWYETFGNKSGIPLLILYGTLGDDMSAIKPKISSLIDLDKFYVILVDQRGCGKSNPLGWFGKNETKYLVKDIELLRKALDISKINIWGHSWGSVLALSYAQKYYINIDNLLLSGVSLGDKGGNTWFINGLKDFFPEEYNMLKKHVPTANTGIDIMKGYYNIVSRSGLSLKKQAVADFANYESLSLGIINNDKDLVKSNLSSSSLPDSYLYRAEILFAYYSNNLYLSPAFLSPVKMKKVDQNTKVKIIQGRYDMRSTVAPAYKLKSMMSNAKLIIVNGAGHNIESSEHYSDAIKKHFSNSQ